MTNKEWLDYLAKNAPDELAAWFDAEHVETKERALDGDTDALERECAELQEQVYKLAAERDKLQEQLLIGWECECRLQAERDELKAELIDERGELNRQINTMRDVIRDLRNERERYRSKFGKCLDYADAIHALMDDEGMA